jgi:MFS family permease
MRDEDPQRFGPLALAAGVTRRHVQALIFAAFTTIGLLTFVAVATPYVLNANLHVPPSEQGGISGTLVVWTEITQLLTFSLFGIISDRIGRRQVYALGYLVMALGYALYPFASSTGELTVYRIVYALGVAATTCMLGTVLSDYPQERSRGRMVAVVGIANGLGVVLFAVLLAKLPRLLVDRGLEPVLAGRYTLALVAAVALVSGLVVAFGLRPGLPVEREERPPVPELVRAGLRAARNPRVALAYASAFVARGDLVILGTFTLLWGQSAAVSDGFSAAEAMEKGRVPFVVAQAAALLWAGGIYFLIDRFNRVTGLAICMGLASVGYLSMIFVGDPLLGTSLPLFALLGLGEISAFFGAQTLIGQEAPIAQRGSVVAFFNFCGAIGILVTSKAGGWLFDHVGPSGPFIMIGALNVAVLLGALVVRVRHPGQPAPGLDLDAARQAT